MACTKEFAMGPSGGFFYYGVVDANVWQPELVNTADEADFLLFLAELTQQAASQLPASPTKFFLENPDSLTNFFFWFAYPDSFGELDATTGFQWAAGDVGAPTAIVEKYNMDAQPVFTNDKRLVSANGFFFGGDLYFGATNWTNEPAINRVAPGIDSNGWARWTRDIDGVTYRFYSFGAWIVEPMAVYSGNSTSRERDSNGYASVGFDNIIDVVAYPYPSQCGVVQVIGVGGTGYNTTQWTNGLFGPNVFYRKNAGPVEAFTADTGGTFNSTSGIISSIMIGSGETWDDGSGGFFPSTIDFTTNEISLFVQGD